MMKRITITMEEELDYQIREIQANTIGKTSRAVSFSQVVNELLKEAIKNRIKVPTNSYSIKFRT